MLATPRARIYSTIVAFLVVTLPPLSGLTALAQANISVGLSAGVSCINV
jgi:hypothetical protein